MKRRVWMGMITVPLLLLGATFWERNVVWERMEEEFRQEIFADATRSSKSSFIVSVMKLSGATDLATLTPSQIKSVLADVHLQKAMPSSDDLPPSIGARFATLDGKSNIVSGFYIGLTEGGGCPLRGGENWDFDNKWRRFELTPASVQVLRHHIWKQYAPKLRAFHIPPPQ